MRRFGQWVKAARYGGQSRATGWRIVAIGCFVILILSAGNGWAETTEPASEDKPSASATAAEVSPSSDLGPRPDPDLIEAGTPAGQPPIPEHEGIEEIIVTAQKRSTDLQETPTAITALTGAQLFDRGIYSVEALATQVPNFQYGETFGIARITIRGVGNQGFTDPSTAFHIDGIYQNNPTAASALTFYDLAAIEVLRGPQGTLWGRNSTAGAINVSTRAPIHDFEVFGDVLYGSYSQVSARGVVNVPIVEERVAARIAGYVDKRDGYQDNLFYPGTDQDADDADNWGLRPQILFDVNDDVRLTLRGMYNHQGGVGWASKIIGDYPDTYLFTPDGLPLPPLGTFYVFVDPYHSYLAPLALGGELMEPNPSDPRQIRRDARQFQDISTWDVNGMLEWDFSLPGLGDVFLNVVGSYRKETRAQNFDGDLSEQDLSVANVTAMTRDRVIEAHLRNADDASVDWLIGFFMLDADGELDVGLPGFGGFTNIYPGLGGKVCLDDFSPGCAQTIWTPSPTLGEPYVRLGNAAVGGSNDTLSLAGYGNVQTKFLDDRLKVGLGLRYTYDRSRATRYSRKVIQISAVSPPPGTCLQPESDPPREEADWSQVTGDLKVDYTPVDEHMLYASISKGYKPGYINGQAVGLGCGDPEADPPIPPNLFNLGNAVRETIWAFEVGSKNRFLDDTIQANLTAFYYRFENFQVTDSALNSTFITNADRARIWGIEFEGIWLPIDEFTVSVVYGYLDAKYTDYQGFNFATLQPEDFSGNQMIRAPKHQATLALEYLLSLNDYGNLIPRAQYIVSDEIYFTAANTNAEREPWFGNLQFRMRWETLEEDIFVEGYVENVTNENVRSTRSVGSAVLGLPITAAYQPPRTWGVRIGGSY